MNVPFANFKRGVETLRSELDAATARVLDSGWFVLGGEGKAFEAEFSAWLGSAHTVGCGSGTDAIELALRALGVRPGDEVVTQANTCVPTISGIARTGATPVLCDVEPEAGTIDPASLEAAITPRTRALVPVHLFGQMGDIDAVLSHGIPVVEDCAQAHGAQAGDRVAGTVGALGAFSFYPTKNLGAIGDAGAVVTDDPELDERLRLVRQYGQAGRYEHVTEGVNSRLDELQAALLRAKLPHLTAWNERRRAIADRYTSALEGTAVTPLARLDDRDHVFHLFVVRAPDRETFRARLEDAGVATLVHYPKPIHGHAPYASLDTGALKVSEQLAGEIVSLPIYPELSDAEVDHVADAARSAAA